MVACENLATKQEVKALEAQIENKIDDSEKQQIIQAGGALGLGLASSKILSVEQLAQQGISSAASAKTIANVASQTASGALQSSVAASQAAKKAGFDALFAQTKAASAASSAAKAGGTAAKALGMVGGVISIIGTLATAAALAALAQQVTEVKKKLSDRQKAFSKYKVETAKTLSQINIIALNALGTANANKEELAVARKEADSIRKKKLTKL